VNPIISGADRGMRLVDSLPIVVPAPAGTVEVTRAGLCILPDLCKTPKARFAQVFGRHPERAAHRLHRPLVVRVPKEKNEQTEGR
jgi:hypothetical protein